MQVEARRGVCGCATPGTIAEGGEEDVSGTAIGTVLSAGIVDVFSDEVVNAADLGGDAAPAAWAQPDPPERAIGRCWLAYERVVGDGVVYVFRHALTQESAYGSLLERHRRAHHCSGASKSSNPSPSTSETDANLTSSGKSREPEYDRSVWIQVRQPKQKGPPASPRVFVGLVVTPPEQREPQERSAEQRQARGLGDRINVAGWRRVVRTEVVPSRLPIVAGISVAT